MPPPPTPTHCLLLTSSNSIHTNNFFRRYCCSAKRQLAYLDISFAYSLNIKLMSNYKIFVFLREYIFYLKKNHTRIYIVLKYNSLD
jgi:hypothetical protein